MSRAMWASLAACRASRETDGMLGCPEAGWEAGVVPVGSVLQRATASDEEGDRTGIRTVGGVAGAILHVGGVQNAGGIMVGTLGNRRGWVVSGPEGRRPTEADGEVDVVVDGDAAGKEAGSLVRGRGLDGSSRSVGLAECERREPGRPLAD